MCEPQQCVSGLEAGYYYVAVMDQNSCTIYDSIEVEDASELLVTISIATNYNGQDISCFGMSDGGESSHYRCYCSCSDKGSST